ncbi:TPA: hypothetical protein ACX3CU_004699 [Vibrio parahaemolyticus]|uniref:hypothetical protein n=1 Tax=Vibrio parahaemolyticus TaxID=670 RepID=UPI00111F28ED|nr:hypothetical protein [Vibrio parahaemolyticus]MBE3906858.1 hypothetical protein [Vibrio parahaemolyticus]TOD75115.1 hypothetical protein CGJ57_17355 [Vibrio parahaemolyticus]TOJ61645.1 hypothetical protein CGI34_25220 [Vibrio parahaemolyticus]
MEISQSVKFNKYGSKTSVSPEAGREYIVIRKSFGSYTSTDTATFMHCTFENTGSEYKGFAKFNGTESQRNQMEITGLIDVYFELLDDVLYFAPLSFYPKRYLDYDLKIYNEKHDVMEKETELARTVMSSFLEHHKVYATKASEECDKRDFGETYDPELVKLWDNAFDMVMSACFGQEQDGYSMSCPV